MENIPKNEPEVTIENKTETENNLDVLNAKKLTELMLNLRNWLRVNENGLRSPEDNSKYIFGVINGNESGAKVEWAIEHRPDPEQRNLSQIIFSSRTNDVTGKYVRKFSFNMNNNVRTIEWESIDSQKPTFAMINKIISACLSSENKKTPKYR